MRVDSVAKKPFLYIRGFYHSSARGVWECIRLFRTAGCPKQAYWLRSVAIRAADICFTRICLIIYRRGKVNITHQRDFKRLSSTTQPSPAYCQQINAANADDFHASSSSVGLVEPVGQALKGRAGSAITGIARTVILLVTERSVALLLSCIFTCAGSKLIFITSFDELTRISTLSIPSRKSLAQIYIRA